MGKGKAGAEKDKPEKQSSSRKAASTTKKAPPVSAKTEDKSKAKAPGPSLPEKNPPAGAKSKGQSTGSASPAKVKSTPVTAAPDSTVPATKATVAVGRSKAGEAESPHRPNDAVPPAASLSDPQASPAAAESGPGLVSSAPPSSARETANDPPDVMEGVALPAARGKVGVFGGPKDRSVKPDDKLALPTGLHLQYERARSLNPKTFYCAMRWDYRQKHMSTEEGKRWWANKRLVVTNPSSGKSVIVRAVDYGPHEKSGLAISVSPSAADALGVEPGHEVEIKFADQRTPLGPVE
ncbi:MAG TPA: hypothetical protein VJX67_17340 [Blastocatellia bacterium]|nr:hypothetical protein [Blastocatellia bacterium]